MADRPRDIAALLAWLAVFPITACEELPRTYDTTPERTRVVVRDGFDGQTLAAHWRATDPSAVEIAGGKLRIENARNHPVWLDVALPVDFRVSFDAWARSEDGDIKVELCGDGHSFATTINYVASGYVLVFGGWNNSLNVIARKNEHGRDRQQIDSPTVEIGRRYRFAITRAGKTLAWELDGRELLTFDDPDPLGGTGNDRFAFSGWEAPVEFDNLVIEAL
jgi:hypothetical protein